MKRLLLILALVLMAAYTANAESTLTNVALSADTVNPDTDVSVTATVGNTNDVPIQNVDVEVTLTGTTVKTTGTVSNVILGSPQTITLTFHVPASALPGAHSVFTKITDRALLTDTHTAEKTLTINQVKTVSLQKGSEATGFTNVLTGIAMQAKPGDLQTLTLTLTNTGNLVLNNVQLKPEFASLKDSDDPANFIRFTATPATINSLPIGGSAQATLTMDVDSGFEIKKLTGNLQLTSDQGTLATVPVTLDVSPSVCATSSTSRDIKLDITDPDDDDEFEPGQEFTVVVNVDNQASEDRRIQVDALFYNTEKDKKVTKQSKTIKINDKDDEDFTFDLKVPEDTSDDDEFEVFIKAFQKGSEDVNCAEDRLSLDIQVPEHKVVIDGFEFTPATAECGDTVYGTLKLKNLGASDETVTVSILNDALKLSQTSSQIELKEDRDKNVETVSFRFLLPQNAKEGNYILEAKADYGGQVKAQKTLVLTCGPTEVAPQPAPQPSNPLTPVTGSSVTETSFFDRFNTSDVPTSVWVLVDVLLGALIILALVMAFRKR